MKKLWDFLDYSIWKVFSEIFGMLLTFQEYFGMYGPFSSVFKNI